MSALMAGVAAGAAARGFPVAVAFAVAGRIAPSCSGKGVACLLHHLGDMVEALLVLLATLALTVGLSAVSGALMLWAARRRLQRPTSRRDSALACALAAVGAALVTVAAVNVVWLLIELAHR